MEVPSRAAALPRELARPDGGEIAGTVFLENDRTPAGAAFVVALRPGDVSPAQTTRAGDDGRYTLAGLPAGLYEVRAWRGAWTLGRRGLERLRVAVEDGSTTEGVDCVLVRGVVVSGEVVEEGSLVPLPGVRIVHDRAVVSSTDREGLFSVEGLPAGEVVLGAWGDRHAARRVYIQAQGGDEPFVRLELPPGGAIHGRVSMPDGRAAPDVRVDLASGEARIEDLTDGEGRYRLAGIPLDARGLVVRASMRGLFESQRMVDGFSEEERAIALELTLTPGDSLAGRIVDETGRPVEGAELYIDWATWEVLAVSDDEGRFRIEGLTGGMELLTAQKAGYAPASQKLSHLEAGDDGLLLVLSPGGAVSGRVIGPEGEGIADALVFASTREPCAGPYPWTVSDGDGTFVITDLPERLDSIGATKRGYCRATLRNVRVGARDVELVMEKGGRITGVVVDRATGEAVSPFSVRVRPSKSRAYRSMGCAPPLSTLITRTGLEFAPEDGMFTVSEGVAVGRRYDLIVAGEDYAETLVAGVEARSPDWTGLPIAVALERGEDVRGRVLCGVSGAPLEGVSVRYAPGESDGGWTGRSRQQGAKRARTDGRGEFRLAGVRPGGGELLLSRRGYARVSHALDSTESMEFLLPREGVLEGRLVSSSSSTSFGSSPLALAVLVEGWRFSGGLTSPDGTFRVTGLPAGKASVEVRDRRRPIARRTVVLSAGETAYLEIDIGRGGIAGSVLESRTGLPARDIWVRLLEEEGRPGDVGGAAARRWNVVREDRTSTGGFRFDALEPGRYVLTAARDRRSPVEGWAGPFTLTGQEEILDAWIVLRGRVRLDVTVVDAADGRAVPGVVARLEPLVGGGGAPLGPLASARGDGRVSFAELPSSRYRLTVDSRDYARWAGDIDLFGNRRLDVALERAAWLVVEVHGPLDVAVSRLVVVATEGEDPGRGGEREMERLLCPDPQGHATARLKMRSGGYRLRFEVADAAGRVLATKSAATTLTPGDESVVGIGVEEPGNP